MKSCGVRLSEAWLFGTEQIKRLWDREDAVKECQHTHPNGRLMDEPQMTEAEAEWMLDHGQFPEAVYSRLKTEWENSQ